MTTAVLVGYMGVTAPDGSPVAPGTGELARAAAPAAGATAAVTQSGARPSGSSTADAFVQNASRPQPSVRRLERVPASAPSAATHGSR